MKRILAIAAVCCALVSCSKYTPFLYRIVTMGFTRSDATLLADDGRVYSFTEGAKPEWGEGTRVMAIMDVRSELTDSTRLASMVSWTAPLYKQPVVVTKDPLPDTLGTDGIAMLDGWYAGGCLNMLNRISVVKGTGTHVVNLLADRRRDSSDTLYLELRHRSDYTPAENEVESNYDFYSSFPIKELVRELDSAVLALSWRWKDTVLTRTAVIKP